MEKKITKQMRYYHKNRAKLIEYSTNWIKNNKDRAKELRQGYETSPKGIFNKIKKLRGDKLFISKDDFLIWYLNQEKKCHYCGILEKDIESKIRTFNRLGRSRMLTIDRKDSLVGYTSQNMVLACDICNIVKSNIFTEEEMLEIGKIIKKRYNI